jgi:hypothetical protein
MNAPVMISKIAHPKYPQFVFEWHEDKQKVYLVTVPGKWVDGHFVQDLTVHSTKAEVIAEHCEHHARFYGFVQTWLRGYNKAKGE